MNPELPQVHPSIESMPQIPGGVEYFPDQSVKTPEVAPASSPEYQPMPIERAPHPIAPAVDPSQIAAPQVQAPTVATVADEQGQSSLAAGTPTVAADDDLIEKEWVDKAKKIISLTKGNPYEQAKAIAALQADYLKKRYSRDIGKVDGTDIG